MTRLERCQTMSLNVCGKFSIWNDELQASFRRAMVSPRLILRVTLNRLLTRRVTTSSPTAREGSARWRDDRHCSKSKFSGDRPCSFKASVSWEGARLRELSLGFDTNSCCPGAHESELLGGVGTDVDDVLACESSTPDDENHYAFFVCQVCYADA